MKKLYESEGLSVFCPENNKMKMEQVLAIGERTLTIGIELDAVLMDKIVKAWENR